MQLGVDRRKATRQRSTVDRDTFEPSSKGLNRVSFVRSGSRLVRPLPES